MSADPLRVLFDLLDAKASAGVAFTVAEAQVDVDLGRERSQRDRAARWGWTRRAVRTLDGGGIPDLSRPEAEAVLETVETPEMARPSTGPAPAQESAPVAQNEATPAHDRPTTGPADSETLSFSCIPPGPPTGVLPPRGPQPADLPSEPGIEPHPGGAPTPGNPAAARLDAGPTPPPVPAAAADRPAKPGRSRKPPMVRPDAATVAAFAAEAGLPDHAEAFVDHFASNGWKVSGRAPMQDWQAAYRGWCRREAKHSRSGVDAAPSVAESLAGPFDAMSAKEAETFARRHGLDSSAFFAAGQDWRGPVWRARVDRLIAAGVVTEAEALASQKRPS